MQGQVGWSGEVRYAYGFCGGVGLEKRLNSTDCLLGEDHMEMLIDTSCFVNENRYCCFAYRDAFRAALYRVFW